MLRVFFFYIVMYCLLEHEFSYTATSNRQHFVRNMNRILDSLSCRFLFTPVTASSVHLYFPASFLSTYGHSRFISLHFLCSFSTIFSSIIFLVLFTGSTIVTMTNIYSQFFSFPLSSVFLDTQYNPLQSLSYMFSLRSIFSFLLCSRLFFLDVKFSSFIPGISICVTLYHTHLFSCCSFPYSS